MLKRTKGWELWISPPKLDKQHYKDFEKRGGEIIVKTVRKMNALTVLIIGASLALLAGIYALYCDRT